MKKYREIIAILIFIEILLCMFMIYSKDNNVNYCTPGSNCESIQNTIYGNILGIPLVWIGFSAFVFLLILFYLQDHHKYLKTLYLLSIALGATYALFLILIQAFILKQFCTICMLIDPIMLLVSYLTYKSYKEDFNLPVHLK
jgi:uncharacterized membrane protein